MALLSVKNLQKSYKLPNNQKQEVLRGLSIEFKSGDLVALLGESGCGKSTLINILGGLDSDFKGSIILKDEYLKDYNENQIDDYRKKRVGLIFQNYELIPTLNIKDNVEMAMTIACIEKEQREERAVELLKLVGLSEFKDKFPNQLSGGQKQRVAIARSLANNPTIILADEPTGALDSQSAELVMKILTKIAESGKLVIMVTHSEKVASQCSRIIKMEDGVIIDDVKNRKISIDKTRDKHIVPKKMQNRELFKLAGKNTKQNKNRSLMISLGMGIAMMVVLLILCLSSGLTTYINILQADQGATNITAYNESFLEINSSDLEDIENLDGVTSVNGNYTLYQADAEYNGSIFDIDSIFSHGADYTEQEMIMGSFLENIDEIIINEELAELITNNIPYSSIGQNIEINGDIFNIVGIYSTSTQGASAFIHEIDMQKISSHYNEINTLNINIEDITYIPSIKSSLNALDLDVYQLASNDAEELLEYVDLATAILIGVGAVSLFVSAVMIFIVLNISVGERKKEIGIMRAIGASRKDIIKMFLFESLIIGGIGGIIALGATLILSTLVNLIAIPVLGSAFISYNILYYLSCFVITIGISVLSGISPAYKASQLDPIESLRGE